MDQMADKLVDQFTERLLQTSFQGQNAENDENEDDDEDEEALRQNAEEDENEEVEEEDNQDLDSTTLASLDDDDEEDTLGLLLGLDGGAKAMKAMAMKKAMKAMKAMAMKKAMKAMKKKKAMKKLKAFTQKRYAFTGKLSKTASGLTKADLVKNKHGKVVSKKKSLLAMKSPWIAAVQKARAALKIKGFKPVKKGTPLYAEAKKLYKPR